MQNHPVAVACLALVLDEDAASAVEYGLLAALIVMACVAAFQALGGSMAALYTAWSAAVIAAI